MSKVAEKRRLLLVQLTNVVNICKTMPNPEIMVYKLWTTKDVLSHLTFCHENFARNVSDLVQEIKPTALKRKLNDLNQAAVDATKPYSLGVIIERLKIAHPLFLRLRTT